MSTMADVLWLYYIYMSDSAQTDPAFILTIFFTAMHILRFYYVMGLPQGLKLQICFPMKFIVICSSFLRNMRLQPNRRLVAQRKHY